VPSAADLQAIAACQQAGRYWDSDDRACTDEPELSCQPFSDNRNYNSAISFCSGLGGTLADPDECPAEILVLASGRETWVRRWSGGGGYDTATDGNLRCQQCAGAGEEKPFVCLAP
jgi:hypothetical protein